MAFNFLTSDFFNVQNDRSSSLPTPPATPVLPSNPLSPPAVPETHPFPSQISPVFYPMNPSSIPGASFSVSALPTDTPARYVPRSFIYNTPVNNNTFGAVNDSGYRSLSSRTPSYHLPSTPTAQLRDKSPCDTYLELYQAGDLKVRTGSGSSWELQCLTCDAWVRTSVPARRPLSIPNHFSNLESHCSSSKCLGRPARASSAPPILSPRKSGSSSGIPQAEDDDDDEQEDLEFHRQHSP